MAIWQLPYKTRAAPQSYNFVFATCCHSVLQSPKSWRHPVDDLPEKPAKPDKTDKPAKSKTTSTSPGVSRRDFLKISGVSAAVPLVSHVSALALDDTARVQGPGKVPVSLNV